MSIGKFYSFILLTWCWGDVCLGHRKRRRRTLRLGYFSYITVPRPVQVLQREIVLHTAGFLFSNNTVKMKQEISEKELEDYICENKMLEQYGIKIVGRQVSSFTVNGCQYDLGGIVDLIGYHPLSKCWFIIELKRGVIDHRAYTQVSRYIKNAVESDYDLFISRCNRSDLYPHPRGLRRIHGLLIGSDIHGDIESFCDYLSDMACLADVGLPSERERYMINEPVNAVYVLDYKVNVTLSL